MESEPTRRSGAGRCWPLWLVVVPLAIWAVARAFGLDGGATLATAMLFTPIAAIACLFVTGVSVALRNWAAATVAAIATVVLAVAVLPRAVGGEYASVAGRPTLSVLSANVYLGDADPRALVALVERHRVDVLAVQELTPSFARRLQGAGIGRRLPQAFLMAERGGRGGGIYSRFPLRRLRFQTPFLFRMPRAAIRLPNGEALRVVGVHPQPPPMSFDRWREALASLPSAGRGSPWLLVGDFNATFDHAKFRAVVEAGYRDAGEATGNGLEPTWPGPDAFPIGLTTIDHVLADRRLGIADYEVEDLAGSDHRAVHARLVLPSPR
jgi:endonuclease/exonuclease/phosphatase (EEP) superfamily protein YafD